MLEIIDRDLLLNMADCQRGDCNLCKLKQYKLKPRDCVALLARLVLCEQEKDITQERKKG